MPSTFSFIHTDLNADNIVYKNGNLAIIDFDDTAYGWHMYDIASALFLLIRGLALIGWLHQRRYLC